MRREIGHAVVRIVMFGALVAACTRAPQPARDPGPVAPTPATTTQAPAVIAVDPPDAALPAKVDPPAPPAPPSPPSPPPAPPPSPGPRRPPPPPPGDPSACTGNADCTVHCPRAPGCCPSAPCGCRAAVNKAHVGEADARYATTCRKAPRCEPVACALEQAAGAACRNGRCVAQSLGGLLDRDGL